MFGSERIGTRKWSDLASWGQASKMEKIYMNSLKVSRRRLMATTATAVALAGFTSVVPSGARRALAATPTKLIVERRTLEVLGRPATVFGIRQPNGTAGVLLDEGERFRIELVNRAGDDTIIHWHGQTPPYRQDGVSDAERPLLKPGSTQAYDFEPRPGTHWMHSHHGLQEQLLMAAPLVVHRAADRKADVQELTILLHDFTFKDPAEILAALTGATASPHQGMAMPGMGDGSGMSGMSGMAGMSDMSGMNNMPGMSGMAMSGMDLNDIDHDAYLANDRTLQDPEVVPVERGGRVRLRLINGATSSAFWIGLGGLEGQVIAVDGNDVAPVAGGSFPMSMGQRLDVLLELPAGDGAFPVFAQREGDRQRAGVVLATKGAAIKKLVSPAASPVPAIDLGLEARLTAVTPLPDRPADVTHRIALTGSMSPYAWSIDNRVFGEHSPLRVAQGQRVVLEMVNSTAMAHPMHLHGHHFQVVALNGKPVKGAVRDTILVPTNGSVSVAFDADNPGRWPLHCHNLLHMATGMMTEVVYG
jgi:FtsP/CotA-like multicopper oxidase with cupredoxin domain